MSLMVARHAAEARARGLRQPAGRSRRALDAAALGLAFEVSPTAMIVTDARLRILAANAAYGRLCREAPSARVGTSSGGSEMTAQAVARRLRGAGHGPPMPWNTTLHRADGSACVTRVTWARMDGVDGLCRTRGLYVATVVEHGTPDDELGQWRHRARHDALTGLANREWFGEELVRAVARADRHDHRLAVLFIDLDGFKSVNDRFGHAAGDRVLAGVGARLRESLRAEDFVARYAGDEFTVMIEAPGQLRDAATAAEAVLRALARGAGGAGDGGLPVTASIGVALYPEHAADADGLLRVADAAMYVAKRAGGNAVEVGLPATALLPMTPRGFVATEPP